MILTDENINKIESMVEEGEELSDEDITDLIDTIRYEMNLRLVPSSSDTFNGYQEQSQKTAIYPGKGTIQGLLYVALGLGESGEVQNKVKKILRDDNGVVSIEKKSAIIDELGDLLWYTAGVASELGVDLAMIANWNVLKLQGRKNRGTIQGEGDKR